MQLVMEVLELFEYNNGRNSAGSTLYIAVTSIFFSSLVNVCGCQIFDFPNHFG